MPAEWERLRHETTAAQVSFLATEVDTGITFARIALNARDSGKSSRNAASARKAYDAIAAYINGLPAKTPGMDEIRAKMRILEDMLRSLESRT